MHDAPPDSTARRYASQLPVRPFSRPAPAPLRPTPLATRSVLFAPRDLGQPVAPPAPDGPAAPEARGGAVEDDVAGARSGDADATTVELASAAEPPVAPPAVASDDDWEDDWGAAADYPVDDLGFPSVPPGYEFALDEAPREALTGEGGEGRPTPETVGAPRREAPARPPAAGGADAGASDAGASDAGASDAGASGDEPPELGVRSVIEGREEVARVLERLAGRVRSGELPVPPSVARGAEASVLAALLARILAPGAGTVDARELASRPR